MTTRYGSMHLLDGISEALREDERGFDDPEKALGLDVDSRTDTEDRSDVLRKDSKNDVAFCLDHLGVVSQIQARNCGANTSSSVNVSCLASRNLLVSIKVATVDSW